MDPSHSFKVFVQWTLWAGVSCMITSGLLSIAFQWRSALRTFGGLTKSLARNKSRVASQMDAIEVPTSWFFAGQLFGLIGLAFLAKATFGMPWWQSTIAVLLTFVLALVACRVTGETDTTPIGAMGKVTQLIFGPLSPGNMTVNLMSANITAGAAASSADLLTDLKSGYLLGANPRKQFLAQFAGIFMGTVVSVLCFRALVPNSLVLGTDQFPAPAAQTWKAVAEALSKGLESLHPLKVWCIAIGGLIGIILPIAAKLFPKQEKWIPSARPWVVMDIPMVYVATIFCGRGSRLQLGKEIGGAIKGIPLPRRVRDHRWRLAYGGRNHLLGKWTRVIEATVP